MTSNPNKKPCECAIAQPGQTNVIPGAMFVGWGHGWQTCTTCGGTGEVPNPGQDGHDPGDET